MLRSEDHSRIIQVMPNWWSGRDLTAMVPKLFANQFSSTSFVAEFNEVLAAFLIGFMSPSVKNEAYIHFVGVDPKFRNQKLAAALYERFFALAKADQRSEIRCCTSPVNKGSVEFHKKMGFVLESGDSVIDGYPVTSNYNKPGDHKVRFLKTL